MLGAGRDPEADPGRRATARISASSRAVAAARNFGHGLHARGVTGRAYYTRCQSGLMASCPPGARARLVSSRGNAWVAWHNLHARVVRFHV